jgi:antitoxin ParD1/3/4
MCIMLHMNDGSQACRRRWIPEESIGPIKVPKFFRRDGWMANRSGMGFNLINVGRLRCGTTQRMSITLTNEMAEFVRDKVARGDYASHSEVLRDALRVIRERDRAVEAWLRDQVVPAAQALRDCPERALSADQLRAELMKSRARRG